MRIGYYLNHIGFFSLVKGHQSLVRPVLWTFIMNFICDYAWTDNIVMFNFADVEDKCIGLPQRFADTGSDKLVMYLSMNSSYALCC